MGNYSIELWLQIRISLLKTNRSRRRSVEIDSYPKGTPRGLGNHCAALRIDSEIKTILNNTVRELPITHLEIKTKAVNDEFIKTTKQKLSRGDVTSYIYSVCDDVLLYSERVTIPKTLQKRILKDFHVGHPGTNRMKSLMWSFDYWPSMDQDITNMVETCKGYDLAAKGPLITHKPLPKSKQ